MTACPKVLGLGKCDIMRVAFMREEEETGRYRHIGHLKDGPRERKAETLLYIYILREFVGGWSG